MLSKFVFSPVFTYTIMTTILANTALIVQEQNEDMRMVNVQVSNAARTHGQSISSQYEVEDWMDLAFLGVYLIELFLKLLVHQIYFFCNEEMNWNIFDLCLVIQGIAEALLTFFKVSTTSDGAGLVSARVLRVFKVGKVLRIFRTLKFLRGLRVMVVSLVSSIQTIFWSLIMMSVILFIFALVMVTFLSEALNNEKWKDVDENISRDAKRYFPDVYVTMMTLYQCASNGIDWRTIDSVLQVDHFARMTLWFYLIFFDFAVMNILSGIFIEKALRHAEPDRRAEACEQRKQDQHDAAALSDLLKDVVDEDGNGFISLSEFEEAVEEDGVKSFMTALGVDVSDAKQVFNVLTEGTARDQIPIQEFCDSCMDLKGTASALHLAGVSCDLNLIRKDLEVIKQVVVPAQDANAITKILTGTSSRMARTRHSQTISRFSQKSHSDFQN